MADDDRESLAEEPKPKRRRRRTLNVDRDEITEIVLRRMDEAEDERGEWRDKRVERYAKLRGWTEREQPPWDGASNVHVPVMMANSLRVKAGLYNAVLGIRPIMTPKVLNAQDRERAEAANNLIDHQVFIDLDGEQIIDAYIHDFVDDGTAVAFTAWSREHRARKDVRVVRRDDRPLIEFMGEHLPNVIMPGAKSIAAKDDDGYSWSAVVETPDGEEIDVEIEVYDRDDTKLDVCLSWEGVVYDGPTVHVHDLDDILVPMRAENSQPISPRNQNGAPWIARLVRVNLDHIRRMEKNGAYDLLTADDMDLIEGMAEGRIPAFLEGDEDRLKTYKDQMAGLQAHYGDHPEDREWLTMAEYYGQWDLDGDGLEEEVIFWIVRETGTLVRARYLTEIYPGEPDQRPFADERFLPVRQEFYGIGLPELMEGLHDLLHVLFNQNIDRGDLTNEPFFFYRASSQLKPDIIRLWPGDGVPLDNPAQDVFFPQMPHADQTWSFNMIGLAMQFMDRLTQIGPLQMGQVPQGKASALRTLGTTMAILQQGAALPEQILRRLFHGLSKVWSQIHAMNGRFLPKQKRYLVVGKGLKDDDAYQVVKDPQDVAIPLSFDFGATLLNTNKGLVSQALTGLGQALFTPLAFQLGTANPETFYNWAKDLIQAQQLDPQRYLVKPAGVPEGPRMSFEEALLMIMQGRLPEVAPLEPIEQHFQKAQEFMQGDQFGILTDVQVALFKEYLMRLTAAMRQALQAQQLAQAAEAFSATLGNQGGGAKEAQSMGSPPDMQMETPRQDELQGAMMGSEG